MEKWIFDPKLVENEYKQNPKPKQKKMQNAKKMLELLLKVNITQNGGYPLSFLILN